MSHDKNNGTSNFAAQFMRTTVAKIKSGGGGITNALELPYEINWTTETPSYALEDYTQPGNQSPIARAATSTVNGYDASTDGYDYAMTQGGTNTRPWHTQINKIAMLEKQIDFTAGFKVMWMVGPSDNDNTNGYNLYLHNSADAYNANGLRLFHEFRAGYDHITGVGTYIDSVLAWHLYIYSPQVAGNDIMPPCEEAIAWGAAGMAVPPNGVGTLTKRISQFGTAAGQPKDINVTIDVEMDLTGFNLDTITLNTNADWYYKNQMVFVWVGAFDAEWPVSAGGTTYNVNGIVQT